MNEQKQIEEMARCCTYYHEGECLADATHPGKCDLMCEMFGVFANLEKEGYRKQSDRYYIEPGKPPVLIETSENKQSEGEWVTEGDELKNTTCSVCGHWVETPYGKTPYCPECGAKMKGGE